MALESSDALLERIGFEKLEALSGELGIGEAVDIAGALLSGEIMPDELPRRALRRFAALLRERLMEALSALAAPVLAAMFLRLALGRQDGSLMLLCRLACACALAQRCAVAARIARDAMAASIRIANTASPVLAAALTMTGSGASGAMLSPLSSMCAWAIENVMMTACIPLCLLAAVTTVGGNLSEHFRLDKLFALLRRMTVWGVRLLVGGFVGLLAVEGRLAAAQDTATSQALQQAVRGLIPFIGGSISDSTGALLDSAAAARSAVGVTGMVIALGACARPVLRLGAHMLSLKLASAAIEPVADIGIARITAGFGEVAKLLMALCAGSGLITALLAGTCLGLFGVA